VWTQKPQPMRRPKMKLQRPKEKVEKFPAIDWKNFLPQPLIGVDEAGRGCLFGPVHAGAVILKSDFGIERFTDSKKINESEREEIFELITAHHFWAVGTASVEEINQINILQAALLAMKRAVYALQVKTGHVLIDGNQKIPGLSHAGLGYDFAQTAIVKGDLRVKPIAAASIVAKVSRDQKMKALTKTYQGYGLEKHKGYATEAHREAIKRLGPSNEHRKFFAGVKEYWDWGISESAENKLKTSHSSTIWRKTTS
jgi:ribonuclease HII